MTLEQIRGAVTLNGGTLTVTPATLGSAGVTQVLAEYFPGSTLVMTAAQIVSTPGDAFVLVQGAAQVLGVQSTLATAKFYAHGGVAQLDFGATLPAGWRPSTSFASLAGTETGGLTLSAPRVDVTSRPGTANAGAMVLSAGYQAPAGWTALTWFANPGASSTLAGAVRVAGGQPTMTLTVSPAIPASLGGYLGVQLGLEHLARSYPRPGDPATRGVTAFSRLAGAVTFSRGAAQVQVPLEVVFPTPPDVLEFRMETGHAFALGLSDVAHWLNGLDLAGQGLPEFYPPPAGLTLRDVSFAVGLGTQTLEYATLSLASTTPWT
ncbi:MAG TPA: hypothetical protein VEQ60_00785, partial [Longimicrobium sp.]|nr:hypothetical protein [Longimicrobium sp.]